MTSLEGDLAFILCRRQFPVQLCFAMTINKSQGQSLSYVGLDLRQPAFSCGQVESAFESPPRAHSSGYTERCLCKSIHHYVL